MVKELSNSPILEELHENEKELHKYEKAIKIAFFLVSVFIILLLTGVSYLIIQSVTSKNPSITKFEVISPSIAPTASPSPSLTLTPFNSTETTKESTTKDYYINIGSGSNQSTDWADVSGALTTADIGQYQNIKEVHFEAFINVPTANGSVSVRLLNKTDNYPVWNSEITRDGTGETYQFISLALVYDTGPKLYQAQMKSHLNVLANLVSARIHIVTE